MVRLVVVRRSTWLAVLVRWRLAVGTSTLGGIGRWSLLLLALLWVSLLLAVAALLSLVTLLWLAICCGLGVIILTVTGWLAVGTVTDADKRTNINWQDIQQPTRFEQLDAFPLQEPQGNLTGLLAVVGTPAVKTHHKKNVCNISKWTHTPVVQWEQLVARIQGRQSGLCRQTDYHKTEKQPE